MTTVYDFSAKTLSGEEKSLGDYRGQVLLIVNTASKCGFTPQYEGLEKLYEKLHDKGLTILGFPCNQFGSQEPGTESEIGAFCQKNYGVSFPMFSKVDVNGADAHPLYKYLKKEERGVLGTEGIKWNFTKFLVDREGNPVERYGSTTKPEDLEGDILKLL
ncbi:MAG TPA: glutathione peroxidase [Rhizomicrobium sp.]|nr:glutathione peroxidase [Rhizomicrobium sp.]